MFNNIGSKIKLLSLIICFISIAISLVLGLYMILKLNQIAFGLLIIFGGSCASYISSFFTYGFGELIEKSAEIAENIKATKQ